MNKWTGYMVTLPHSYALCLSCTKWPSVFFRPVWGCRDTTEDPWHEGRNRDEQSESHQGQRAA